MGRRFRFNNLIRLIVTAVALASALGLSVPKITQAVSNGSGSIASTISGDSHIDVTDYSNTSVAFQAADGSTVSIPAYSGEGVYVVNGNEPFFTDADLTYGGTYVTFSSLDDYGRAQVANAVLGPETMQTHERGDISDIHPSGWWEAKASDVNVNRCHLIGNQLGGDQTDTTFNMVTGARHFNTPVMTDYENPTADYIEKTGNHVRYRVTPVFENNDSTCHGVLMEAESIEDGEAGLKFCVYCYNIQPGYVCDYQIGEWSKIDG